MHYLQFGDRGYGDELLVGFFVTICLAGLSFILSMALGVALGTLALSESRPARIAWRTYASLVMGVPSIVVVFFIYYNAPFLLSSGLDLRVEVTPFAAGASGLVIVYAAYVGENFRGAVINIPHGLFEAGRALGLRTLPLWWLVILPQVWRLSVPGLTNIWLILLKDTALVSLVGLTDISRMSYVAAGVTKLPFLFFTVAGLSFITLTFLTLLVSGRIEHYLNRGYELQRGR
jgi:His/Glu/Gln/Arg/opine family amino acid ABC transporter permease subunit